MLIIAIPKSASTSLLETYCKRHDLKGYMGSQGFNRPELINENISEGYDLLGKYHFTDFKEVTNYMAKKYQSPLHLYKAHISPTEHNIEKLANVNKIVCLRKPSEIIKAYYRAELKGIHDKKKEFSGIRNLKEWLIKSKEIGLFGELKKFYNGWIMNENQNNIIFFEDLLESTDQTLKKMDRAFGLPELEGKVALARRKYSRNSITKKILYKFKNLKK